MAIIFLLISFIFPILSLPFGGFGIIFSKNKKIYSFIFAFSLAFIAYCWVPTKTYDLYRWHLEMMTLSNYSFGKFIKFSVDNVEVINYLFKYLLSFTKNFDLLQFFVVFLGYFSIFFMISDYAQKNNIRKFSIFITLLFTILSMYYINFISGLWCFFAIIVFSFGLYCKEFLKTKYIHWIICVLSIFIHVSAIYPLILVLFNSFSKRKNRIFNIVIISMIFLLSKYIIMFISNILPLGYGNMLSHLYDVYFVNGEQFSVLHRGINLIMAFLRIVPYFFILLIYQNKKETEFSSIITLCYYLIATLIILNIFLNATVFIRYVYLLQLICIPLILKFFSNRKLTYYSLLVLIYIFVICISLEYKQITILVKSDIFNNIKDNLFSNILELIR